MTNDETFELQNRDDDPKSILVALDSSTGAEQVLAMGARIARAYPQATLHVVHVLRTSRFDRAHAGAPTALPETLADAKEHLEFFLRSARRQCRNAVLGHFSVGAPTDEILRLAGELRADLLLVGTHDYRGFERWLLGSVAETLVRKARCSVIVVRKPEA